MYGHLKTLWAWYLRHATRAFHLENGWRNWHRTLIKREPFRDMLSRDLSLLIFVVGYHVVILGALAAVIGVYLLVKAVT